MIATLCLYGCVLAPAQPSDRTAPPTRGEWSLEPRLSRAQELSYRGTFTEKADSPRVQFVRSYGVELRAFVLDSSSSGSSVAFLTVLKSRDPGPAGSSTADAASSVRLEVVKLSPRGRVLAEPSVLAVPLQGLPSSECGAFVEVPLGRVALGQTWDVGEPGRPVRTWTAVGPEMVNGAGCVKLVGEQKSDDWDHPRGDRPSWRRRDTVWLSTRSGVAYRVERVIERLEPGHSKANWRSELRYDLDSSLQFSGDYDERAEDIRQARAFADAASPLLTEPARHGPQLASLLGRINFHLEQHPARSPYREAVLQVKRRVEAARRGETPPAPPPDDEPPPPGASLGAPAPDFLAPDLVLGGSARLRSWVGRPILLVFYSPGAPIAPDVLRFAQGLAAQHPQGLTVLALSVSGKAEAALKQRQQLKLTLPLLDGSGLLTTFGVQATPRFALIDAAGVVRGLYLGWGDETVGELQEELKRWVR
jgi:hypothetical protein